MTLIPEAGSVEQVADRIYRAVRSGQWDKERVREYLSLWASAPAPVEARPDLALRNIQLYVRSRKDLRDGPHGEHLLRFCQEGDLDNLPTRAAPVESAPPPERIPFPIAPACGAVHDVRVICGLEVNHEGDHATYMFTPAIYWKQAPVESAPGAVPRKDYQTSGVWFCGLHHRVLEPSGLKDGDCPMCAANSQPRAPASPPAAEPRCVKCSLPASVHPVTWHAPGGEKRECREYVPPAAPLGICGRCSGHGWMRDGTKCVACGGTGRRDTP